MISPFGYPMTVHMLLLLIHLMVPATLRSQSLPERYLGYTIGWWNSTISLWRRQPNSIHCKVELALLLLGMSCTHPPPFCVSASVQVPMPSHWIGRLKNSFLHILPSKCSLEDRYIR
uniref:Secreted protein n=1 Tax=Arundo donax TaxID=35708 RepID=A0A0A9CS55_ARUDO